MIDIQSQGFLRIVETLEEGVEGIASAVEWGFTELNWQIDQQTAVLKSIDRSIKTPGETQANEWRVMAERLRLRGGVIK